jgi:hypothetical protein
MAKPAVTKFYQVSRNNDPSLGVDISKWVLDRLQQEIETIWQSLIVTKCSNWERKHNTAGGTVLSIARVFR